MKCLIEPTTNIMLMLDHGEVVQPDRPSVVTVSNFLASRLATGALKLLHTGLPDTASDAEFVKFLRDCKPDRELAISSFLSTFEAPVGGEEPQAPLPTLEEEEEEPVEPQEVEVTSHRGRRSKG